MLDEHRAMECASRERSLLFSRINLNYYISYKINIQVTVGKRLKSFEVTREIVELELKI